MVRRGRFGSIGATGLRGKLLALVLSVLLPFFLMVLYSEYEGWQHNVAHELAHKGDLALSVRAAFTRYLDGIWSMELALGPALAPDGVLLPVARAEAILEAQMVAHQGLKAMAWVSPEGVVLAATDPTLRNVSLADRDHFRQIAAGQARVISDVIVDRGSSGQPIVVVGREVRYQGELVGEVFAAVDLSRLGEVLDQQSTGTYALGLVDRQGTVAFSGDINPAVPRALGKDHPAWRALQGETVQAAGYLMGAGTRRRLGAFVPVEPIGWVAFATAWEDEAFAAAEAKMQRFMIWLGAVSAFSLLLAYVLAGRLLRSARDLERAARALSQGDLNARTPPHGDDELAAAQAAFNQMADQIQQVQGELYKRSRQQAAVAQLGQQALSGLSLHELAQLAAKTVAAELGMGLAYVKEYLPATEELVTRGGSGDHIPKVCARRTAATADYLFGYALRSGAPVIMADAATETRFGLPPIMAEHKVASAMAVVIPGGEVPYGILAVFCTEPRSFGVEDVHFVAAVANVLSTVVLRQRANQRRAVVQAVTHVLAESSTLAEAAPRLLKVIGDGLQWEIGFAWKVDAEAGVLCCTDGWRVGRSQDAEWIRECQALVLSPGVEVAGRIWSAGRPIWSEVPLEGPPTPRRAMAERAGIRTAAGLPITLGSEVLGVLEFASTEVRLADADLLELLAAVGSQIGQFVERVRAEEALRSSHKQFQALVRAAPLAIVTTDRDLVIQGWNPAAERMFGWSEAETLGQVIRGGPDDRDEIPLSLRERTFSGETVIGEVIRQRRKDGSAVDVSLAIAPAWGADGQVIGVIFLAWDVTERTRFIQIAAHELRNPLAGIKGVISLMSRRLAAGRPPGDALQLVGLMERETNRLSHLVSDILETFRLQEGRLTLNLVPVDLGAVLVDALAPYRHLHPERRFDLALPPGGKVWVMGDPTRLEEVVRNLVENAVKYSPPVGPVTVRLTAEGGRTLVAVADEGYGVPTDELSRIFEGFYRSRLLAGRDPGGMGLGLHICREIIQRHGGRIWAESAVGQGSVFFIELREADSHGTGAGSGR